jgi:hypothetical protein
VLLDSAIKWLLPQESKFFVYLTSMGSNVQAAAEVFAELQTAKTKEDFLRISGALRRKEHETDELAHLIYGELDKTFITPIDREDLHALTSALDEVLDSMDRCGNEIVLYKLDKMTDPMRELVRIIQEAAREIAKCVALLSDQSKVDEVQVHVIHVNSLENEGDKVYRKGVEALFDNMIDPIELIRQKEILTSLEDAIDACEDVMDVIRSIMVKNA